MIVGRVLVLAVLAFQPAWATVNLQLDTGPGRLGELSWSSLDFQFAPLESPDGRSLHLEIQDLRVAEVLPSVDVMLRCMHFRWLAHGLDCDSAELELIFQSYETIALEGLSWRSQADGGMQFVWEGGAGRAELSWAGGRERPSLALKLAELDLSAVPAVWLEQINLQLLDGMLSADLVLVEGTLRGAVHWLEGALDGLEGRIAAEGLAVEVEIEAQMQPAARSGAADGRIVIRQVAGELLLDNLYLPPPKFPLALEADWLLSEPERLQITRFSMTDPETLSALGSAEIQRVQDRWQLHKLDIAELELGLASFGQRWLEGPAAAAGFPGLNLGGSVSGSLAWRTGDALLTNANLSLHDLSLQDPQERIAVYGLQSTLVGELDRITSEVAWEAARLWGVPLGSSALSVHGDELGWRLLEPFRVPVMDGQIVFDGLAWFNSPDLSSQLILDARIEPISLALLTRQLGLIELGGTLAGRFPGVQYQDQRLSFTGGIDIDAFSGRIAVEDLEVERPFGTLPALAAQVEFHRLDLLELTGAFDFGRMEGRMSGWMRDLRLLDWRPVAMDTRLFTHEDVPRRRISQRAVENLSSLGGAGGAILSGTILRIFDDFSYRRAGLACRLSNNICHIDGVAPHESGGFLIVEGRGLPRLDVVGHRRLVDWPQLVRQLETIREPDDS